jgi:hypothetical protein
MRCDVGSEEGQSGGSAIQGWLETLRGLDLTDTEVEAAAERLLTDTKQALPILLAQFVDPKEDAALLAVTTVTLKRWPEPHPVKPLMGLLRSPSVGALGKALIMKVLERYGIDVDSSGLFGVAVDLEEYELDTGAGSGGVSQN